MAKLDNHGYIEQILSGLKPGDCYSIRIFYYTAISGNPGFQIEINHSPLETDQ